MQSNTELAIMASSIVLAAVEYLKMPLISTPRILSFLTQHGIARVDGDGVVHMWCIPYITFVMGVAFTVMFKIDLFADRMPDVSQLARTVLTSVVVGVGSNLIHSLSGKRAIVKRLLKLP